MRTLMITGASGFIGGNLAIVARSAWRVIGTRNSHRPELDGVTWVDMDFTDEQSVQRAFDETAPDAVVHLGAISSIDLCEREPEFARAVNVNGTRNVAEASHRLGARLISISTDNVFDGKRGDYSEDDPVSPINTYGQTKVEAEEIVRASASNALVVRIPLVFGFPVTGRGSHFAGLMNTIRADRSLWFITSEVRTPIDVRTLSRALLELVDTKTSGVLHVAGTEAVDRGVMGCAFLAKLGLPEDRAEYYTTQDGRGNRPENISLNVSRASTVLQTALPDFRTAMDRAFDDALPDQTKL